MSIGGPTAEARAPGGRGPRHALCSAVLLPRAGPAGPLVPNNFSAGALRHAALRGTCRRPARPAHKAEARPRPGQGRNPAAAACWVMEWRRNRRGSRRAPPRPAECAQYGLFPLGVREPRRQAVPLAPAGPRRRQAGQGVQGDASAGEAPARASPARPVWPYRLTYIFLRSRSALRPGGAGHPAGRVVWPPTAPRRHGGAASPSITIGPARPAPPRTTSRQGITRYQR